MSANRFHENKTVLLLGGTGAIGVYLIEESLNLGFSVYVTTRNNRRSNNPNLHYINGNAKDEGFILSIITEHKFSVIVDFMVYSTNEFDKRIDLLLSSESHYFFISTYRVFAASCDDILESSPLLLDVVEDNAYLSTDEYALAKARQERILKSKNKSNWTIVRPSITYSKNRFQLGTLEANVFFPRALKFLDVPIPSNILHKKTTMTWAGDVAKMIGQLMLNKNAYKEDFNVLTSESITWEEVSNIYKERINLNIQEVSLERFNWLCGNIWQLKYDRMIDRSCNNNKILSMTGLKQIDLLSVKDGISFEISNNEYKQYLSTLNRAQGRVDRILGIWQWPFKDSFKNTLTYILGRVSLFDAILLKLKR